jgi:hypothetical protein
VFILLFISSCGDQSATGSLPWLKTKQYFQEQVQHEKEAQERPETFAFRHAREDQGNQNTDDQVH